MLIAGISASAGVAGRTQDADDRRMARSSSLLAWGWPAFRGDWFSLGVAALGAFRLVETIHCRDSDGDNVAGLPLVLWSIQDDSFLNANTQNCAPL